MADILGEEADIAICETCEATKSLEEGVRCEPCGGFYCRGVCWNTHLCDGLADHNGLSVRVGDHLKYRDGHKYFYEVIEIWPSWTKHYACVGSRLNKKGQMNGLRYALYPRLMEIIHKE